MAVCAHYDTVDKSLNFIENTGGWTNGQQVMNQEGIVIKIYYTGFDTNVYNTVDSKVPWFNVTDEIRVINFKTQITPISTQYWFKGFISCTAINNLNLLNTSNVTTMRSMFRECPALTSLDLSNFDTSNVTTMSEMFLDCMSLKYIRVSNLWTTTNVVHSTNMFTVCTSLSNFNSSYTDITRAYVGDDGNGNWGYLVDEACAYYDSSDNSLNFVGNDHGYTNNQVVGTKTYYTGFETDNYHTGPNSPIAGLNRPWWYPVRSNINTVNFYISVMPIAASRWFSGLNYLSNINNLNLLNTSNVTDMSEMFMSCTSLTSLDLSNFDTSNVTDMSGMFSTCTSLSTLDLSNFNTSNVTDMSQMFLNCSATIPIFYVFNTPTVTRIFRMYSTGNNQIYLARDNSVNANTTIRDFWSNVASSYNNVHFEYDDAPWPTVSPVIDRGVYDSNNQWVEDIQGNVIKIKFNAQVYNSNVASVLSSNELTSIEIEVYGRSINTDYTVNSSSSQMINNDTGYLTLITEPDSQYEVDITLTDKRGTGIMYTAIIIGAFAMVEFRKGGHGMSIGKISERDGLDISIPTAIGEGLLLPINQQGETDLAKQQLVVGKYNRRNPDASFIIGNGADETHRSNALEIYNNGAVSFDNNAGQGILAAIIDLIYPIGCYFETSNPTFDPNLEFGGTWVEETPGMVHISAGTGYPFGHANDNNGVGAQDGGSPYIQEHSHTFNGGALPTHTHGMSHTHVPNSTTYKYFMVTSSSGITDDTSAALSDGNYKFPRISSNYAFTSHSTTGTSSITSTGNNTSATTSGTVGNINTANLSKGQSGNMQPYIVVYRWHRYA